MQSHVSRLIVAFLVLTGARTSRAEETPQELAKIVEEAHVAAGSVTHGTLSGTFQREHEDADGKWQTVDEATLTGSFKDGRYRLRLDYTRQRLDEDRRTIVYDGETLAVGTWCKRINPTGQRGELFPMKRRQPDAPMAPTIAEFSWDISRFRSVVLNPAGAFQNKPAFKDKLVRTKAGDIELRAEEPRLRIEVLFRKDHGFLPCRMAAAGPMDEKVVQEEVCDWKQHKEGWFPKRLTRTFRPKNRPGDRAVPPDRCTLDLTEVKLDVTPDDSGFTEAALELATGTRILDRRPK